MSAALTAAPSGNGTSSSNRLSRHLHLRTLSTIDWPNIAATLASAFIGGLIAAGVAGRQIKASHSAERDKTRRECARDLIESIDSFLHIAYRSETPDSRLERQRLRRRILSLLVMCLPERFDATQTHLDGIDTWWRRRRSNSAQRIAGMGFTATEQFFDDLKSSLFEEVFGIRVVLSRVNEGAEELPF